MLSSVRDALQRRPLDECLDREELRFGSCARSASCFGRLHGRAELAFDETLEVPLDSQTSYTYHPWSDPPAVWRIRPSGASPSGIGKAPNIASVNCL